MVAPDESDESKGSNQRNQTGRCDFFFGAKTNHPDRFDSSIDSSNNREQATVSQAQNILNRHLARLSSHFGLKRLTNA